MCNLTTRSKFIINFFYHFLYILHPICPIFCPCPMRSARCVLFFFRSFSRSRAVGRALVFAPLFSPASSFPTMSCQGDRTQKKIRRVGGLGCRLRPITPLPHPPQKITGRLLRLGGLPPPQPHPLPSFIPFLPFPTRLVLDSQKKKYAYPPVFRQVPSGRLFGFPGQFGRSSRLHFLMRTYP